MITENKINKSYPDKETHTRKNELEMNWRWWKKKQTLISLPRQQQQQQQQQNIMENLKIERVRPKKIGVKW